MAISAVVLIALASLIGQSTSNYSRAQRAVNSMSQARAFAQFLESELSTRLPDSPLTVKRDDDFSSDKIAFTRVMSPYEEDEFAPGDLMGCIYFVAMSSEELGHSVPSLYRKRLTFAETQTFLVAGSKTTIPSYGVSESEPMIHNVVSFLMELMYRDESSGELEKWTVDLLPIRPSVMIYTLKFLDETTAIRFSGKAAWKRLATKPEDHELALIRVFKHTIYLSK